MSDMDEDKKYTDGIAELENDKENAIEAIKKFANEDETDKTRDVTLRSVLGGDILQSSFMMKQVIFVMFLAVLMILYTGNRYASQQDAILIDGLHVELQTMKYNVLTISSDLTNLTRQSVIERQMRNFADTTLRKSTYPPFEIKSEE